MGNLVLTKKDLTKADNVLLNEKQLSFILSKTPEKYIKKRPAKGGGSWNYVSISYVQKCLNLMFGWDWSFEVEKEDIFIEAGEVVVKGKLTINITYKDDLGYPHSTKVIKTQYGNKDIQFLNEPVKENGKVVYENGKVKKRKTNKPLSIGNDLKAAASDALKKCASQIGLAQDVYAPEDFREVEIKQEIDVAQALSDCDSKEAIQDVWKQLSEEQQNSYINLFKMLEK